MKKQKFTYHAGALGMGPEPTWTDLSQVDDESRWAARERVGSRRSPPVTGQEDDSPANHQVEVMESGLPKEQPSVETVRPQDLQQTTTKENEIASNREMVDARVDITGGTSKKKKAEEALSPDLLKELDDLMGGMEAMVSEAMEQDNRRPTYKAPASTEVAREEVASSQDTPDGPNLPPTTVTADEHGTDLRDSFNRQRMVVASTKTSNTEMRDSLDGPNLTSDMEGIDGPRKTLASAKTSSKGVTDLQTVQNSAASHDHEELTNAQDSFDVPESSAGDEPVSASLPPKRSGSKVRFEEAIPRRDIIPPPPLPPAFEEDDFRDAEHDISITVSAPPGFAADEEEEEEEEEFGSPRHGAFVEEDNIADVSL